MPKISVITPAYNAEKYITQAIESVQAQNFEDYEHIIVDDGSTDMTWGIIQEHGKNDKRIIAIKQKNAGPGAARNRGMKEATGEYILFIDADDFVAVKLLGKLVEKIKQTNADVIIFSFSMFDDKTNEILGTHKIDFYPNKEPFTKRDAKDILFTKFPIITVTSCFNAQLIKSAYLEFSQKYKRDEDVDFVLRLFVAAQTFAVIDEPLYFYRQNVATSETATNSKYPFEILRIIKDFYPTIHQKVPYLYATYATYATYAITQVNGAIHRQIAFPSAHRKAYDYAKKEIIPLLKLYKRNEKEYANEQDYQVIQTLTKGSYEEYLLLVLTLLQNHNDFLTGRLEKTQAHADSLQAHADSLQAHTDSLQAHTDSLQAHTDSLQAHINYSESFKGSVKNLLVKTKHKILRK